MSDSLADRIRAGCIHRGWSFGELAQRAGISRTTLSHLASGRTGRPHNDTLQRIAVALELPIDTLVYSAPSPVSPPRLRTDRNPASAAAEFDRATNPAVAEAVRERPELFAGWNDEELDELQSLFGTGGALTPRGVELAAEAINRRRETVHKLQIVLETHLREDVTQMVEMFYRMVQPPQMRTPATKIERPLDEVMA